MIEQELKTIRETFIATVEDVCWRHLVIGIREVREYMGFHPDWIARRDVVLVDGRVIVVKIVRENNLFCIREEKESGK